jgi:hypothetical protein
MQSELFPGEAHTLIRNLERRRALMSRLSTNPQKNIPTIRIKDSLGKYLARIYRGRTSEEIQKINCRVFALINRAASLANGSQDTAVVTSMYAHQYRGARPIDELKYGAFLMEVKNIVLLCKEHRVKIKSITGMQNGLGVPKTDALDALLAWCRDNEVDLKSITGMQHGLGVPKTDALDALLAWCRDNEVDLKSITGMQNGLGVPKTDALDALLAWCRDNEIDLKSITGMQTGLGVPKTDALDVFLKHLPT